MAPRGRPRKGASRMDAAISAVTPLGYPKEKVRAKVKYLLKVYGGDAGYPFIEADAYKVLIEAILDDEDSKQEKASLKTPNTGGPSTSIESACSHTPNTAQVNRGDDNKWKTASRSPEKRTADSADAFSAEELMYSPVPHGGAPPSPPLIAASPPPPPQSIPAQRRKPCYGYIGGEDEEEETDFVFLTPMPPGRLFEEQMKSSNSKTVRRSNRRSRWDVRPEDM